MPFKSFNAGRDWIKIGQSVPATSQVSKAFDALNLFAIFTQEMESPGVSVEVSKLPQNTEWGPGIDVIEYVAMPQCYKFWISETGSFVQFAGGTAADDSCEYDFDSSTIKSYDVEITLDPAGASQLQCYGDLELTPGNNDCKQEADNGTGQLVEIRLELEGCSPGCTVTGFDSEGIAAVSANFVGSPAANTGIEVEYNSTTFYLDLDQDYILNIREGFKDPENFDVRVEFVEPIEEIKLAAGSFEFSVKSDGFEICRATAEAGCN